MILPLNLQPPTDKRHVQVQLAYYTGGTILTGQPNSCARAPVSTYQLLNTETGAVGLQRYDIPDCR